MEQRLIDANKLKGDLNKLPMMSNWGESFVPVLIDDQPTINPETMPIVQELREKLEQVTAERDALATNSRLVVYGKWVKIYEDGEPAVKQHQIGVCCSKCMKIPKDRFTESDFCPHCGADMRGEPKKEE